MIVFPAIKAKMGSWDYFMVKMNMRELSENVKFATDVYDDHTLSEAIQRVLNESRAKTSIATYLVKQRDRFFSSIVVAALDGNPNWYPVTMEEDPRFDLFKGDKRLSESFGVLSFDGSQNYYALDGQHRLKAIKSLVDPTSEMSLQAPPDFKNEEVSVIVVVPRAAEDMTEFMRRYRRLFGNLNRYAKPMDPVTNIIMDEDDSFAIVTRELISEYEFFKWTGRHRSSARVKTEGGKNIKKTDSYFTSLETLYNMNIELLSSIKRKSAGWDADGVQKDDFRRFRPSEDVIESLYKELQSYWDGLLKTLPVLRNKPVDMRDHNATAESGTEDSIFFWPIGQQLLVEVARKLLNYQPDPDNPTVESIEKALKPLAHIKHNFKDVPWRHLLLIPDDQDWSNWKIRNEDRPKAVNLATRIVMWQIGLDELSEQEIEELKNEWTLKLLPALTDDQIHSLWDSIEDGVHR
ncbi:MAG: DGQHR domain-containing protein [Comamonadaceae bacterium]|nr:MAG: DGQHR domain-containing protein [Comamonadaceae bacterium]